MGILGVVRPIEMHCQSLLSCTLQKIDNYITAPLLQQTVMLLTARCHIHSSPDNEKSAPPFLDAAFRRNSLTTFHYYAASQQFG